MGLSSSSDNYTSSNYLGYKIDGTSRLVNDNNFIDNTEIRGSESKDDSILDINELIPHEETTNTNDTTKNTLEIGMDNIDDNIYDPTSQTDYSQTLATEEHKGIGENETVELDVESITGNMKDDNSLLGIESTPGKNETITTTPDNNSDLNLPNNTLETPTLPDSNTQVGPINPDIAEENDSKSSKTVDLENNANITVENGNIIISTEINGNNYEISVDEKEYRRNLKSLGLTNTDINKLLSGSTTLPELIIEIQNDESEERKRHMYELLYMSGIDIDAYDIDDVNDIINNLTLQKQELIDQLDDIEEPSEIEFFSHILDQFIQGKDLDTLINSTIVAWKYTDLDGNEHIVFEEPTSEEKIQFDVEYLSYLDYYGETDNLKKLRELTTQEINPLIGKPYTINIWNSTEEQYEFLNQVYENYGEDQNNKKAKQEQIAELREQINALYNEIEQYTSIRDYVQHNIDYYFDNIYEYENRDDFIDNIMIKGDALDNIRSLIYAINGVEGYQLPDSCKDKSRDYNIIDLSDDALIADLMYCIFNGLVEIDENSTNIIVKSPDGSYNLESQFWANSGFFVDNYLEWLPLMTEDEKIVFNYIYNTEGKESALKYLHDIESEIDNRWLDYRKTQDEEFAENNRLLASMLSVFITPIEGMGAALYTINSKAVGERMTRTNIYSMGDIYRSYIAKVISKSSRFGGFMYSTAMSMLDSLELIGIAALTGGSNVILSGVLMGSRAYVSTLNDAFDRGLTENQAIALAVSSAIFETAMESYSLGHLFNLEGKLGNLTTSAMEKIANSIGNERVANIVTKSFYIFAGSISQGLAEGEEEIATEMLNYFADIFISQDLSEYAERVQYYLDLGYDDDEAALKTMNDFKDRLEEAFLGGFASGLFFGAFGSIRTTIDISSEIADGNYLDTRHQSTQAQAFTNAVEIRQQQIALINEGFEVNEALALAEAMIFDGLSKETAINIAKTLNNNITLENIRSLIDMANRNNMTINEAINLYNSSLQIANQIITSPSMDTRIELLNKLSGIELVHVFSILKNNTNICNQLMSNTNSQYMQTLTKELMKPTLDYYQAAAEFAGSGTATAFLTYRTHCEGHVLEVAQKTMESVVAIQQALESNGFTGFSSNVNLYECYIAALWHDTGMAAGAAGVPGLDSYTDADGNIKTRNLVETSGGDLTRSNHSFNSAMSVLMNADQISALGVDPNVIALLCFSHSKSNSGVSVLNSSTDWSLCISKINDAVNFYNQQNPTNPITFANGGTDFIESLVDSGILLNTDSTQANKKVKGKNVNYNQYNLNTDALNRLASEAFALRLGDANTNNRNLGTNQAGNKIDINSLTGAINNSFVLYDNMFNNIKALVISEATGIDYKEVLRRMELDKGDPERIGFFGTKTGLTINIGNQTLNLDSGSFAFILGENNIDFSTHVNSDGLLVETFTIIDPTSIPASTLFNIDERLGELDTATIGGFVSGVEIRLNGEGLTQNQKTEIENYYMEFLNSRSNYSNNSTVVWY